MTATAKTRESYPAKRDNKSVAKARILYNQDPQRHLLTVAHALYASAYRKRYARELVELRVELMMELDTLISADFNHYYGSDHNDRIDMVSTYLVFIARRKELSPAQQRHFLQTASMLCINALEYAGSPLNMKHSHSYYLIATTYASLHIGSPVGLVWLQIVGDGAPIHVADPNQKSRIYRRLGLLFPDTAPLWGDFTFAASMVGMYWALKACAVPGTNAKTRLKSIYALTGHGY